MVSHRSPKPKAQETGSLQEQQKDNKNGTSHTLPNVGFPCVLTGEKNPIHAHQEDTLITASRFKYPEK